MGNYQNITKEELIIAYERLQQLNNFLVSSYKKEEKSATEEEKLREKALQFRKLSANVPDLIFQFTRRTDGSYFVPIASEGIINIFGCSPEDVLNDFTPIARVIYPEDAERVINDIEYSAEHLNYFTCEFRVQLPGKEIQWILSKSTPEKLPDGSVTWYGFNADITEQKKAEEKLKNAALLLQSSIESPKDIIILSIDKNYKYLYFNECHRLTMLHAYGQEVKIGMNLLDCITSEEDRIKAKINYVKALNGESHITVEEYGEIEKAYYETRYNPIFNDNNEIIGTTAFSADITEHKQAEKKIREQHDYIKMIMDNLPIGIATNEIDSMKVTYMNRKFSEIYGWPEADFPYIGAFFEKVFPDLAYRQEVQTKILADIESGDSERMSWDNLKITTKAGEKRIVYGHNIPLVTQNIMVSTVQDITKRKKAEEILEESNALIKIAGEKAKLGGWIVNLDENRCFWSNEVAAIHDVPKGYSPLLEEAIGFFAPEWRDKITEVFTNCTQNGIPYDEEMQILTSKGKRVWVRTIGEALKDSSGKIVKVQGAFQDITARKIADEELKKSQLLLKASLESQKNTILFSVDTEYRYLFFNKTHSDGVKAAYHKDLQIGTNTLEYITSDALRIETKSHFDLALKGISNSNIQQYGDGNPLWFEAFYNPLYNEQQEIIGATCLGMNITERKQAEKALLAKMDELERFQKLTVGREITMVALKKEVNNLLNKLGEDNKYKIVE